MMIDPDRKTYWELLETLTWIVTRDDRRVAALQECSDQDKMALALWGMKVRMVIHSPPGSWGRNRGADLETPAPQGNKGAPHPLDDVLAKVQSGRVGVTTISCDGDTNEQIPVPLAELNDLEFLLMPSHPVCAGGTLVAIALNPGLEVAPVSSGCGRLPIAVSICAMSTASPAARRRRAAFCPRWPMRWRRRVICTNTARPASSWRRSRWRPRNGHCSTRRHGEKPLTIDEVLSARMVSYPLTVRDCCLITDGGGAVIMTTDEGARSLKKNRRSMSSAAARRLLMPVFRACPI